MRKMIPLGVCLCFAALVLAIVKPTSCTAQTTPWNDTAARQEMQAFQQFLKDHPWIAKKLRENPSRANDKDFLNGNPELPGFLNAHPFIARAL
jgi:hypothetical protein